MSATLPTASELDVWLKGYVAGSGVSLARALNTLHFDVVAWLRVNNDRACLAVPELPELERRASASRTPSAKLAAVRGLLGAVDRTLDNKEKDDAIQAQAVMPLQLGIHPTGIGGEE